MKAESIDDILTMLLRGLVMLENDLKTKVLVEKISNDIRIKYLNTLKIVMYLTFKLTNHFEKKLQSSKDHDLLNGSTLKGKGGKKGNFTKKTSDLADGQGDWNETRDKILNSISRIVQLNIQKLWDPPIVEEQFVMLVVLLLITKNKET
jgi:condensin complex subunit 1